MQYKLVRKEQRNNHMVTNQQMGFERKLRNLLYVKGSSGTIISILMNITHCDNCCVKKGRRRKVCPMHMLTMKSIGAQSSKIKSRVTVGLCPIYNKSGNIFENIIPCYRNDGKCYMPAFTLPTDDAYYEKNEQKYRREHQRKIKEYSTDKSQLWEPKPNGKSKFCSVCKTEYDDYKEHIETQYHHQCIRSNRYSVYIEQVAEEIQRNKKRRSPYELEDVPSKYRAVDFEVLTTDDSKITTN